VSTGSNLTLSEVVGEFYPFVSTRLKARLSLQYINPNQLVLVVEAQDPSSAYQDAVTYTLNVAP
jgi:hypothetical protein